MTQLASPFRCRQFPLQEIAEELRRKGATSLPLLNKSFTQALLAEAERCPLRPARRIIGKAPDEVHQRMTVCERLPAGSLYTYLSEAFQSLFDAAIENTGQSIFDGRVSFNDRVLQRYGAGKLGISPHRDRTAYRHLVCLFVIAGHGRFYICRDRTGADAREIPNVPGDVIVMRAPGFKGGDERPFHYLEDIRETRYVFGLRHDQTKLEGHAEPLGV